MNLLFENASRDELHKQEAGDDERDLHNQQPQGGNQLR